MNVPAPRVAFPGERPGDAEVHDPGVAVAVDHDVLGLEVAMDDTLAVGFGQPFRDLAGDGDGFVDGQPAERRMKLLRFAPNVLHRDVVSALIFTEIVHAGDVRVADLAYKKGPDPLCLQSRAALENAFCGDKIPADVYWAHEMRRSP